METLKHYLITNVCEPLMGCVLTSELPKDGNALLWPVIGVYGHCVVQVRGQVSDRGWGGICIQSKVSSRFIYIEMKRVVIYVCFVFKHSWVGTWWLYTDLRLIQLALWSPLLLTRVLPMTFPLCSHLVFYISSQREVPLEIRDKTLLNPTKRTGVYDYGNIFDQSKISIHADPNDKHFMTEVALFVVGHKDTALTSMCEKNKWRASDDTEKVWEAISEEKWHLFELPNRERPATQALAICAVYQTRSEPSKTCCVQSLQRMPWPHTKLFLWLSWSQYNKNDFILWLYNGIEVAIYSSCWRNSWQNWTPYVIYTLYINIFQRQKWFVVYLVKAVYPSRHTSIANLLKRIHNLSPETLVYFFISCIMHEKAWENKMTVRRLFRCTGGEEMCTLK